MLGKLRTYLTTHFTQHITLYFIVILCFSIGVTTGVFSVKALSEVQKNQLIDYLVSSFKSLLIDEQVNNTQIFMQSALQNIKTILFIWLSCVAMITFPIALFIVGIRGFTLGFTVGFLIENLGYRGILFSTVSILPQQLIIIPLIIVFSVISINYSLTMIKNRKNKRYLKGENSKLFIGYSFITLLLSILLVIGSFTEAYVSPVLIRGISSYLIG